MSVFKMGDIHESHPLQPVLRRKDRKEEGDRDLAAGRIAGEIAARIKGGIRMTDTRQAIAEDEEGHQAE